MSSLCDMPALKVLFLGSYFKKKKRKSVMLYILLREIASLWKRSKFILSIFTILCNIIDFYLNLVFNMVLFQRRQKQLTEALKIQFPHFCNRDNAF